MSRQVHVDVLVHVLVDVAGQETRGLHWPITWYGRRGGNAALADQLRRAALSIPLNVAEAAGKISAADRARYYATARGSAMECAAILDVCRALGVLSANRGSAKALLVRIVAMLTKLCR